MTSQIELTTVHRSQDEKHLAFVSAIRESQPSRQQIREYFELPVDRFLGVERTLEQWLDFGMVQHRLHGHPFVWICNTNRGVAKVSRAALRRLGISMEEVESEGYLGDPSVKGSLRICLRKASGCGSLVIWTSLVAS